MSIRLVLADDHPFILEGLESLFRHEPGFRVLARCIDGEQTLEAVRTHLPDILILDIRMPNKDGLDVLRELKKEKIKVKVVLLTAALDESEVTEAVRLGVRGVVLKEMAPELLIQCVSKVHAGERWTDDGYLACTLDKAAREKPLSHKMLASLTPREVEMIWMVTAGLRNKEIAEKLFISEGTVKIHLHNIYRKLNLDGRLQLLCYARDKGLI